MKSLNSVKKGVERAWRRKLLFSERASEWDHTENLCGGVSGNDQEQVCRESCEDLVLIMS